MNKNWIVSLAMILALAACSSAPRVVQQKTVVGEFEGNYVIKNTGIDHFTAETSNIFAKYSSIYFHPLDFSKTEINTDRLDFRDKDWSFTDKEKRIFNNTLQTELKAKYEKTTTLNVLDTPSSDAIALKVSVLKFTPTASKDDFKSRDAREKVFSFSYGQMLTRYTFIDSTSGKILAVAEDREEIGETPRKLDRNNRVRNIHEMKLEIQRWASRLTASSVALGAR